MFEPLSRLHLAPSPSYSGERVGVRGGTSSCAFIANGATSRPAPHPALSPEYEGEGKIGPWARLACSERGRRGRYGPDLRVAEQFGSVGPMQAAKRPPRPGFTLLELVIALTLSAAMAAVMVVSLGVAFKARRAAERAVGPARTKEVVMQYLRDDFLCALPPRGQFAGSFIGTNLQDGRGFDGDDLTFYTTTASPFHTEGTNGEIKHVELTVYQPTGSDDYVLVRRVWNNLLSPTQENPDEEVICRHVTAFNLRYFDGTAWQDSWDSTQQSNALPLAVEVTLGIDTLDLNPDGSPRYSQTVRVFPFPCTGKSNDTTSTSTSGSSPAGGGS
ncbi:MAG: hypothetical protein JWO87_1582 [Phycisphaerales bacterium]|nr:hypothetical protein [Phycisphaerales bacterium]